jgi:hypothetical protein
MFVCKGKKLDKDLKLVFEIKDSLNNGDAKFKENYDKLMIVNPSKKKFKDTVLNETHSEPCSLMILKTGISEVFS